MKNLRLVVIFLVLVVGGYFLFTHTTGMKNVDMIGGETSSVPVDATDIAYFEGVKGYYAHPVETAPEHAPYPGVVIIHEWWGLNEHIKETARQLAGQGYHVLAVDLFDGKVASTADEARAQVQGLNQARALQNLKAALTYLREGQGVTKVASLGWCFGGGQSLQLALSGQQLDATVIYYGQLVTDETMLGKISWPVLGIFGKEDQSIPTETVESFRKTLDALRVENTVKIYPDVGHAFANPSGDNYAPEETKDAWIRTLQFLNAALK